MLINLTPHAVNIRRADGTFLNVPPSGSIARCAVETTVARVVEGIVYSRAVFGEVTGLPEEITPLVSFLRKVEMPTYIVSMLVRQALPSRADLVSPGALIRDENGTVVGCDGLTVS